MKRWICAVLAVMMLLPVFSTTAFASGHCHGRGYSGHSWVVNQQCASNKACTNNADSVNNGTCANSCRYADENADNICDNCNNRCADCGEVKDDNADGICDNCGKCSHYADENNDGVCDYQAECENRKNAVREPVHRKSSSHGRSDRNHH